MSETAKNPDSTISSQQEQFEELQLRVTRFSAVEQELINTRDYLDNELARFEAISEFNRRAIVTEDLVVFAEVVAEAIVDVFELEVGMFFSVDLEKSQIVAESLVGGDQNSGEVYSVDFSRFHQESTPVIESREQCELWEKLQLLQVIWAPCFNENNELFALIAGGRTQTNQAFYDEITPKLRNSFKVFTQQTESLLRNLLTQQHLVASQKTADEANQAKSIFLANMSHEIRTPMNGVLGMAQLLSSSQLTPEQKDFVQKIINSGEHLLDIINNILDFSKIEADRLELESISFSVNELFDSVADTLASNAQKDGLELILLADPQIPETLIGDPVRLRQIILNLAGNAIKFTKQGHVFIHACVERAISENELMLRFSIEDSGIGVSPEKQANLFEAFMQVDGSMTRQYGGTGLGLAISRRLADLMGGKIGIDSEKGRGSTFWFTAKLSSYLPKNKNSASCAEFNGRRILVVENSELNRRWFEVMLPAWGLQLQVVANGTQAAECWAEETFDAILIDTTLPEDFEKLCAQMDASKAVASVPRLGLYPMAQAGHMHQSKWFVDSFSKPIKADHLRSFLRQIFSAPAIAKYGTGFGENSKHVVLVDNHMIFSELLGRVLEKNKIRVSVVNNHTTAENLFEGNRCNLILLDSFLAEQTDWELVRRIRSGRTRASADLPIIILTDEPPDEKRESAQEKISAYIEKTLPLEMLHEKIKQWLEPQPRRNGHILLVEDNPINQIVAAELLKKEGFEVTVADDGKKALEICGKGQFDLILLDIQMPVMNGYETIEAIRRGGTPNATRPILALTASADNMTRKKMESAKFDAIITKPFKAPKLIEAIEQALKNTGQY